MADTIKMNMTTDAANEILKQMNYRNSNDDDETSLVSTSKQPQVYTCLSDDASSKAVAVTMDAARQFLLNKLHIYHEDSNNPVMRVILHDDLVLQTLRICETLDNKPLTAATGHAHCLIIGQHGQGITTAVNLSSIAIGYKLHTLEIEQDSMTLSSSHTALSYSGTYDTFIAQVKSVYMLALQSSEPLILLIRDADVLHDRVLSIINSIVTDGTIPAYSMSSKEQ
eukprot:19491-Heterococcus_DN1.PRE.1